MNNQSMYQFENNQTNLIQPKYQFGDVFSFDSVKSSLEKTLLECEQCDQTEKENDEDINKEKIIIMLNSDRYDEDDEYYHLLSMIESGEIKNNDRLEGETSFQKLFNLLTTSDFNFTDFTDPNEIEKEMLAFTSAESAESWESGDSHDLEKESDDVEKLISLFINNDYFELCGKNNDIRFCIDYHHYDILEQIFLEAKDYQLINYILLEACQTEKISILDSFKNVINLSSFKDDDTILSTYLLTLCSSDYWELFKEELEDLIFLQEKRYLFDEIKDDLCDDFKEYFDL